MEGKIWLGTKNVKLIMGKALQHVWKLQNWWGYVQKGRQWICSPNMVGGRFLEKLKAHVYESWEDLKEARMLAIKENKKFSILLAKSNFNGPTPSCPAPYLQANVILEKDHKWASRKKLTTWEPKLLTYSKSTAWFLLGVFQETWKSFSYLLLIWTSRFQIKAY